MQDVALTKRESELFEKRGQHARYRAGQSLFYRGHLPYGAFVLHSGTIEMRKGHRDRRALGVVHAPAILGFEPIFRACPYRYTAVAKDTVTVSFIDKELFLEWLKNGEPVLQRVRQLVPEAKPSNRSTRTSRTRGDE